jgi:regulator of replication initiation timing
MLKQLLMSTEASAERTQFSRRKWQFASLILAMMLIPAFVIIGWLYLEMNVTGTQRGRLQMKNQTLKEQLNTADTQIAGFTDERQALLNQNIELANENIKLKSQNAQTIASAPAQAVETEQKPEGQQVTSKNDEFEGQAIDAGRVEAIRKGTYPRGAARAELIAVLGEPDRVYKARGYEQLVYFGHKPGRFWFIGNWLVETSE